ncbi:MAG: hypothetical protein SH868_19395 [Bythopirellula sp.]|nr:hypothetical protein [Bythopirellula sp.]
MRRFVAACGLVLSLSLAVNAQENTESVATGWRLTPELADAYREYALARQQLIRYRQVTLPTKRQAVADATQQTQWELAVLNRRLADYRPFLAVGDYSPVRTAAENDFLNRNATAQRLRQLQDDDIALMRFSGETDELYQYDVLRAALRVRAAQAALGQ